MSNEAQPSRDPELEEAIRRIRQRIAVSAESRMKLEPVESPTQATAAPEGSRIAPQAEAEGSAHPQIPKQARVLKARRVESGLSQNAVASLSQFNQLLAECRRTLAYLNLPPERHGLKGTIANWIQAASRRILNWFITPSVEFDNRAMRALEQIARELDAVQQELHFLREQTTSPPEDETPGPRAKL
jgi:hypothetical protein